MPSSFGFHLVPASMVLGCGFATSTASARGEDRTPITRQHAVSRVQLDGFRPNVSGFGPHPGSSAWTIPQWRVLYSIRASHSVLTRDILVLGLTNSSKGLSSIMPVVAATGARTRGLHARRCRASDPLCRGNRRTARCTGSPVARHPAPGGVHLHPLRRCRSTA